MKRVLITCPPMLRQLQKFEATFLEYEFQVTAPQLIQTMSVRDLIEIVPEHDGWIIGDDPATAEVFKAGKAGRLKAAVKWGVGTDNLDISACERLGIPITNTPGMFGSEVADLAMCYILGLARDAFYIDRAVRSGGWPKPAGISLTGKTLGIIGLGDIGKNVAKRANAHDLHILGWDPFACSLPDYIELKSSWPSGIERCDFILFCCALTNDTRHLFNKSLLEALKPGVRVINVSRGPLIDEGVLLSALSSGLVSSAALDVFENEPIKSDHPVLAHDRCILGSHNASNTIDAVLRASDKAIRLLHELMEQ